MDVRSILIPTYTTAACVEQLAFQHQIVHHSAQEDHALLNAIQGLQIATTYMRTDARSILKLIPVTVALVAQFVLATMATQLARLEPAASYAILGLGTVMEMHPMDVRSTPAPIHSTAAAVETL